MYTREDLIADVIVEANNIKQHATIEEIAKLDFKYLHPNHSKKCIYGQMTGYCHSERAAQLIEKCTPRYFNGKVMPMIVGFAIPMSVVSNNVNGTTVNNFVKDRTTQSICHYSAIEAYILLEDANSKNLIDIIKGTTQNLEL